MDVNKARELVKSILSTSRYDHTIRVADTAEQLAKKYDVSQEKAVLAAILHDYAKCFPTDELKRLITYYQLPQQLLQFNKELWHGPVGAMIVQDKYGVTDQEILNAIYYHTTARENMGKLEKIIFIADYIEPGRSFPGVEEVREKVQINLDLAIQMALRNTIIYLLNKSVTIFPDTFYAYNAFMKNWEGD